MPRPFRAASALPLRDCAHMRVDFRLDGEGPLCVAAREAGFDRFAGLARGVAAIPYGRICEPDDWLAVLTENRGTCSSKHRLLAAVAEECFETRVTLTVGLYDMSEENTPGVGAILAAAGVASLPEAHCYLTVGHERLDYTGLTPGARSPFDSLRSEHSVTTAQLTAEKARLHRQALTSWANARAMQFEVAWALRERCIAALEERASARLGKHNGI